MARVAHLHLSHSEFKPFELQTADPDIMKIMDTADHVVLGAAATMAVGSDPNPSLRVGVIMTIDKGHATREFLTLEEVVCIIRGAVDQLDEALERQFGTAAMEIALSDEVESIIDDNDTSDPRMN